MERLRLYTAILKDHLERHRQMALVSGPRQVGKTTTCRALGDAYFNWDNTDDRRRWPMSCNWTACVPGLR